MKRNPMPPRRALTGSAYSRIDPTDEMLQAMWEDADAVGGEAQWIARWHPLGQAQWLGGERGKGSRTWHPSARVKAAFQKMHEAAKLTQEASHELARFMMERAQGTAKLGEAVIDNPAKHKLRKRSSR